MLENKMKKISVFAVLTVLLMSVLLWASPANAEEVEDPVTYPMTLAFNLYATLIKDEVSMGDKKLIKSISKTVNNYEEAVAFSSTSAIEADTGEIVGKFGIAVSDVCSFSVQSYTPVNSGDPQTNGIVMGVIITTHDLYWVTEKAATCGASGVKHQACRNCTDFRGADVTIPATGSHSFVYDGITWIGSPEEGYTGATADFHCSTCQEKKNVPASGSSLTAEVKEPTCGLGGYTTYKVEISNCPDGSKHSGQIRGKETAPTEQHQWEWVPDVPATCGEEGTKYQKCKNCDATQAKGTKVEKTPHVWKDDPVFEFNDDSSKILATFTCENDPSHTIQVEAHESGDIGVVLPTATEQGYYYCPVTVTLEEVDYTGEVRVYIPKATEDTYHLYGDLVTWTKGSGVPAELCFERRTCDDITFKVFNGIMMDGEPVDKERYTAEEGSVVITLGADYLETLSEGEHVMTVNFIDGNAETVLTVIAEEPEVPATGVEDHAGLYSCLTVVSLVSLAAVQMYRKRIVG